MPIRSDYPFLSDSYRSESVRAREMWSHRFEPQMNCHIHRVCLHSAPSLHSASRARMSDFHHIAYSYTVQQIAQSLSDQWHSLPPSNYSSSPGAERGPRGETWRKWALVSVKSPGWQSKQYHVTIMSPFILRVSFLPSKAWRVVCLVYFPQALMGPP